MAKYKKRSNNAQMSSSDNNKDSNSWYDESADPTSSQDKSSDILDSSRSNNSTPREIKHTAYSINNQDEESEELKPVLVYDTTAKDGIPDADTTVTIEKLVSVVPSPYYDKHQVMTTNPFLATMSLWQRYISAWFRVWNVFFRYPAE